jgi:hypothetical protein
LTQPITLFSLVPLTSPSPFTTHHHLILLSLPLSPKRPTLSCRFLPLSLVSPFPLYLSPLVQRVTPSLTTAVLNLNPSGSPLTFRSAVSGPFRSQWLLVSDNELIKLVETYRTLCPVHFADSLPTYYNPVAREKWSPSSLLLPGSARSYDTDVDRRVRGTAAGDRLESSVPPSTLVASLPCVNILFNSVVSSDAFFGFVDLTDFYLESPLAAPQFIKIYTNIFSPQVLSRLSLLPF